MQCMLLIIHLCICLMNRETKIIYLNWLDTFDTIFFASWEHTNRRKRINSPKWNLQFIGRTIFFLIVRKLHRKLKSVFSATNPTQLFRDRKPPFERKYNTYIHIYYNTFFRTIDHFWYNKYIIFDISNNNKSYNGSVLKMALIFFWTYSLGLGFFPKVQRDPHLEYRIMFTFKFDVVFVLQQQ